MSQLEYRELALSDLAKIRERDRSEDVSVGFRVVEGEMRAEAIRHAPPGEAVPVAWEYQWTLGDVVTALCQAGLQIAWVDEHPQHFWPQLPHIQEEEMCRIPHSYSVLAVARLTYSGHSR